MTRHPINRYDRRLLNEKKKKARQERAGKVRRKLARIITEERESQDAVTQFLAHTDDTNLPGVLETTP